MTRYQFDRIFTRMAQKFGRIYWGEEDGYAYPLFSMESNALKVHRDDPSANSRRMQEAIGLVLFDIQSRLSGEEADTSQFRNEANEKLENALLYSFDPFTNELVWGAVTDNYGTEELTAEQLEEYYMLPVRCLLRIKESVDFWVKERGSDGYFNYLENSIGEAVAPGSHMEASALLVKNPS